MQEISLFRSSGGLLNFGVFVYKGEIKGSIHLFCLCYIPLNDTGEQCYHSKAIAYAIPQPLHT
jgi:hypothetical protein